MTQTRVVILFNSLWGHMKTLALAAAEGAKKVEGVQVEILRIPEILPEEALAAMGAGEAQKAMSEFPIATPEQLETADAVLFGLPTRFGLMAGSAKQFLDSLGAQWGSNAFVGKLAGVMTSTATQHGGQEATILSAHTSLLHFGFLLVGLPYSFPEQKSLEFITGGSPYGASTITGGKGERMPNENELTLAAHQGNHLAKLALQLTTGKAKVAEEKKAEDDSKAAAVSPSSSETRLAAELPKGSENRKSCCSIS